MGDGGIKAVATALRMSRAFKRTTLMLSGRGDSTNELEDSRAKDIWVSSQRAAEHTSGYPSVAQGDACGFQKSFTCGALVTLCISRETCSDGWSDTDLE